MHCRLAVGPLGKRVAVLSRYPHRLDPILGDVGVVDRQYSLAFAQRGRFPVRRQDRCVVPARLAQEQLLHVHGIGIGRSRARSAYDGLATAW